MIPRVDMVDPSTPCSLYPMNVAQLMDTGPGVHSEIENISKSSSDGRNLCFSHISFSMKGSIEYPPPKVNNPILKNTLNNTYRVLYFKVTLHYLFSKNIKFLSSQKFFIL